MKKIKTAEEYLIGCEHDGSYIPVNEVIKLINLSQLEMLEYAVNKCAENAFAIGKGTNLTTKNSNLYWTFAGSIGDVIIDKQSILKTIEEIKKELE